MDSTDIVNPPSQPKAKHPVGNNRGLQQAYNLRDLASKRAIALSLIEPKDLDEELSLAQALRCYDVVWKDASDRIRILRGRPLPGSLKPERKVKPKPKVSDEPSY